MATPPARSSMCFLLTSRLYWLFGDTKAQSELCAPQKTRPRRRFKDVGPDYLAKPWVRAAKISQSNPKSTFLQIEK